jgi:hypothetical protein
MVPAAAAATTTIVLLALEVAAPTATAATIPTTATKLPWRSLLALCLEVTARTAIPTTATKLPWRSLLALCLEVAAPAAIPAAATAKLLRSKLPVLEPARRPATEVLAGILAKALEGLWLLTLESLPVPVTACAAAKAAAIPIVIAGEILCPVVLVSEISAAIEAASGKTMAAIEVAA